MHCEPGRAHEGQRFPWAFGARWSNGSHGRPTGAHTRPQGATRGRDERDLPQFINGGCVASLFKRIMPLLVGRHPAQLLHAVADLHAAILSANPPNDGQARFSLVLSRYLINEGFDLSNEGRTVLLGDVPQTDVRRRHHHVVGGSNVQLHPLWLM